MAKIGMGLAEGCKQSNCTLSGGETAILPELVHGFDIAGTSVGYVKQDKIIEMPANNLSVIYTLN